MEVEALLKALEKITEIAPRLDRLEKKLDSLIDATPVRQFIDTEWICAELGCSRDWIRSRPWMLPNFGNPDITGRPRRWKCITWETWKSDLKSREQAWKAMSEIERRRVVKAAS